MIEVDGTDCPLMPDVWNGVKWGVILGSNGDQERVMRELNKYTLDGYTHYCVTHNTSERFQINVGKAV